MSSAMVALLALGFVAATMLVEAGISRRNEKRLLARGAVEPSGDVYRTMQWAYPGAFIAMAVEGALIGSMPGIATVAGAVLMLASKALKYWAIGSLGARWTFRVLVVPDRLVTRGPYQWVRHPNYVAVVGELVSMALLVGARITGPIAILLFSLLIRKRVAVEDRALRHLTCS